MEMIAGVKVQDLARQFGTPLYVYDQAAIERRVAQMKDFGRLRFAVKSLSNIAILVLMKKLGVFVDCVSEGEILRAMKAGFVPDSEPAEIVYTCDIFDRGALESVIKYNILVNFGSIDMIHQYGPIAKRKGIILRINPGFGHGHSQKTNTGGPSSKHGIWHEDLPQAVYTAVHYGLEVEGIHMHIGSGTDLEHLALVCDAMRDTVHRLGSSIRVISAGGGLPIPYRKGEQEINLDEYKSLWWNVRDKLSEDIGHEIVLEAEPGRFFSAESGYLIGEIRAVKQQGDNLFYLVDAGFNNLLRPIMYGAYHEISVCCISPSNGTTQEAAVAGPLCESGDVFTQTEGGFVHFRELPEASVGDYVIIHTAGSYGSSMSSNYNSRPYCAEVLISKQQPHLIRKRQELSELIANEMIPEYLNDY